MIIFDTNVISEIIKENCAPAVRQWLTTISADEMATTAINAIELRSGAAILPNGKRKAALLLAIETSLEVLFGLRVFPYDLHSAMHHAEIISSMRPKGKDILLADCMIAAIARQRNCSVATRDVSPFRHAGLAVINPWADELAPQPGR